MQRFDTRIDTPLGPMLLTTDGASIHVLDFVDGDVPALPIPAAVAAFAQNVREAIAAYFERRLTTFAFALSPAGTPFQRDVWSALCEIPYGETVSYAAIARRVGMPSAVRAVGAANGRNPIAIIIPCHRVIGSDGRLVGYAGGLPRKRALLALEAPAASLFAA